MDMSGSLSKRTPRTPGLAEAAIEAFAINLRFREEARALRHLLRLHKSDWPDDILRSLDRLGGFGPLFPSTDRHSLRSLLTHHAQLVLVGKFDAEYLASTEEIAFIFRRHNVAAMPIAGAWNDLRLALMDLIVTDDRMADRILRRDAYRALSGWIGLEVAVSWYVMSRQA